MSENLIAGFLKIRNGILRGDLYRVILNMEQFCDELFVCDDASYDGTKEWLQEYLPPSNLICVPPEEWDFKNELYWKEQLLQLIHKNGPFQYLWWQDGDEVLDARGTAGIRDLCKKHIGHNDIQGWRFHYTQFWRNTSYARTDDQFDDGYFIKLWRYDPQLTFAVTAGTHHQQFPQQMMGYLQTGKIADAKWDVLHYGNVGQDLKYKGLQYYGGLGGVERHLSFEHAEYRKVDPKVIPEDAEKIPSDTPPQPFTIEQKKHIYQMKDLKQLEKTFCVVIPTFNRGDFLRRTLDSVLKQTYENWICFVLDDGSTDNTPYILHEYLENDPRFFYGRYLENKGGVAINEIGMDIACETAEWWVRLGSDDWLEPNKLELDYEALQSGHPAVFGPFQVHRNMQFQEIGNRPIPVEFGKQALATPGGFIASWANVACHTDVLRKIKQKFGNYVDPRLVNMEDAHFNFRVSLFYDWVWRGIVNGEFVVNPKYDFCQQAQQENWKIQADAYWNVNEIGASANSNQYAIDRRLTDEIIARERSTPRS
jgi:glycosyltransferase involved in cell wall biosynthesis